VDDTGAGTGTGTGAFAERLLAVVDEGQRTATYKLALLLALIDATAGSVGEHGRAPAVIGTRTVAAEVVGLYLPQVRPFPSPDGREVELRQITARAKGSVTLDAVRGLRAATGADTAERARVADAAAFDRTVRVVERNFVRYPIDLLQRVGAESRPFLYTVEPDRGGPSQRSLRFLPGAGDELLRLAPLVRPLVEVHWARMVADLNGASLLEDRLRVHLFGADRVSFPRALRSSIAELQQGRCFYCDARLGRATQVDHFVPWSRWPNDAIENLVLADACNGRKSNHLAAPGHVARWAERLESHGADLRSIAAASGWTSAASRSVGLARSAYAHAPAGTPLWSAPSDFVFADPAEAVEHLSGLHVGRSGGGGPRGGPPPPPGPGCT
jgi:hypothetical protein